MLVSRNGSAISARRSAGLGSAGRQLGLTPQASASYHPDTNLEPPETPVRFHMHLLPTYFPDRDPPFERYFQNLLEQVALAEELGWECFWFTEHHFLLYGGPIPNPAVMMAAAAARTTRIRLGSAIAILPLHHPVQLAEDYAMVDAISGGRLEFGIGIGNSAIDYEVYGVPRDDSRGRFQEAIAAILNAWTEQTLSHKGKRWQFTGAPVYPRPAQQPHPPVWVAGSSVESLRWAGTHGFNIMTVAHPYPAERVRPGVAAWREGLVQGGHDPAAHHCKLHLRVWVDEDRDRARQVAEPAIQRYDDVSRVGRESAIRDPGAAGYDWEGMLAQGRNIYGNPEDCIRLIRTAAANYDFDVCSTTFNFGGIPHDAIIKAMRLFAQEVMPALRN